MIDQANDTFAPWISDPDDPNEAIITSEEAKNAGKIVAVLHPELVDRSLDGPIFKPAAKTVLGRSLATWAAAIAADEKARIDNAVRTGLIGGLDNTAIARKVVGSAGLRGIDGVTEVTRQRIALLGRAAIKPRNPRK